MRISAENHRLILYPEANLVASTVEDLRNAFMDALKTNTESKIVILDAENINVVDSMGVNLIIGLFRQVNSEGRDFHIDKVRPEFMKVINFFKLTTLFTITSLENKL